MARYKWLVSAILALLVLWLVASNAHALADRVLDGRDSDPVVLVMLMGFALAVIWLVDRSAREVFRHLWGGGNGNKPHPTNGASQ